MHEWVNAGDIFYKLGGNYIVMKCGMISDNSSNIIVSKQHLNKHKPGYQLAVQKVSVNPVFLLPKKYWLNEF